MPKRARLRKTVRVRSDGKVINGWNCGVLVLYLPAALAAAGGVLAWRGWLL